MSECTHDCGSCGANCSSRENNIEDLRAQLNDSSSVKKVIAVISGKGGVGKSFVTSLMACAMEQRGYKTAVLDADITGPSIPRAFGIADKRAASTGDAIVPVSTRTGIDVMSINLLLEDETQPVIWRGPVIAGAVKQFWTDVNWTDVDFMFVDMPPGTGDVPLTVFQSLPVDGIIVVTSPQEMVSMIVSKAVNMARMMDVPILGIVENMSYFKCPDCGKVHHIFGDSHIDQLAVLNNLLVLAKLPIDPVYPNACDRGEIESVQCGELSYAADVVESLIK